MTELTILEKKENLFQTELNTSLRDGVPIEKGAVISETYLNEHQKIIQRYMEYFIEYPDCFLDLIKPEDDDFTLFFYQRILLRAMMRFKEIYITAGRATAKSFIAVLALFLQCTFIPNTKRCIIMPNKNQAAKMATRKIEEIYQHFPLLKREVVGWQLSDRPGNFGKDYIQLTFRTGSQLVIVGGDSTRGDRENGGLFDELRDHDSELVQEVYLPLFNVARRLPDNTVNPREPNAQKIFCTSAGTKSSFAYEQLLDTFENSIINPDESFCIGMDYRIPILHGLTDKRFINSLKMSPSFDEASFATEYRLMYSLIIENCWKNLRVYQATA